LHFFVSVAPRPTPRLLRLLPFQVRIAVVALLFN